MTALRVMVGLAFAAISLAVPLALSSPASDARAHAGPVMRQYRAAHPACEACGATDGVEVHHIIPCHVAPDKADDLGNLITLCRPCHHVLGHANDQRWQRYAPNVREVLRVREVRP